MKKEASIALCLLYTFASCADAQSDSARTASPRHRTPSVAAWGTVGLGAASFAGARASTFPPTLLEVWLTVGPVALGHRRVDAGGGINLDYTCRESL